MSNTKGWENEAREYFNLRYEILDIRKQPKGNREHWVEADIAFITKKLQERTEDCAKVADDVRDLYANKEDSGVMKASDFIAKQIRSINKPNN